jgi:hypothetical protein
MRQSLFVLVFLACAPAWGSPLGTIDQSVEFLDLGFASGARPAQVFTVGRDGILTSVEVPLCPMSPGVNQITVNLRLLAVVNGKPSGMPTDELVYRSVVAIRNNSNFGGFSWTALDGIALPVSAGDQFAIAVADVNYNPVDWAAYKGQPYEGGGPWVWNISGYQSFPGIDGFSFRTYVAPIPEPASIVIATTAMICIASRRRK